MSVVSLHPDFGKPEFREAACPGGWVVNLAAIVEIARTEDTPRSRALYAELCAAWRRTEGLPLTVDARRRQVFETAWAAMLRKHGPAPKGVGA